MFAPASTLDRRQRRQIASITLGAVAAFVAFRLLPTGTHLSHMDFRVNAKNAIEFCDPLNPQFIPVVAVASPVALTLSPAAAVEAGHESAFTLTLKTAKGKTIAPEDLTIAHTKLLHLLVVDSTLTDYQHVHPTPGDRKGEWTFGFTPRRSGVYRIFADFTPAATGRSLYASTDLAVAEGAGETVALPPAAGNAESLVRGGFRFALLPANSRIRAGEPADLKFSIGREGSGGSVPLQPVMGAFAHLVAFDASRSGFAHLHPMETDLEKPPAETHPVLHFKITIPRPGNYVIWSQVNLAGQETFVPFRFEVGP